MTNVFEYHSYLNYFNISHGMPKSMMRFLTRSALCAPKFLRSRDISVAPVVAPTPTVAPCLTHHIINTEPAYAERYLNVTSFHAPENLAAARSIDGAFHIDFAGHPVYTYRFKHTYGMYCGAAAVCDASGQWYHIRASGEPLYSARWKWCGNYTTVPPTIKDESGLECLRCPVASQTENGGEDFYLIDGRGVIRDGPFAYAGNYNSHGECVVWLRDGSPKIIDSAGLSIYAGPWLDMQPPHKGVAAVKSKEGWRFIRRDGSHLNAMVYEAVEPFYNGRAKVRMMSSIHAVVNEDGTVILQLPKSFAEAEAELNATTLSYWKSLVQPNNVLSRTRYWLQDRYFRSWLPHLQPDPSPTPSNVFASIASNPSLVSLSHTVLGEYVRELSRSVERCLIHIPADSVVCDVGGGCGTLCTEVGVRRPDLHFICFDRAEVVEHSTTTSNPSNVTFIAGDFFTGGIPKADVYILSRILHDWDDEHAAQILHNLASSSSSLSTVLIIDRIKSEQNRHGLLSLHMMLLQNACERSLVEWKDLFSKTMFSMQSIESIESGYSIMTLKKISGTAKPLVRKAVVPIAGHGSRMYPWTSIAPKSMVPFNTINENTKEESTVPALKVLLDDIASIPQIECIYIVIAPHMRSLLQTFLNEFYSSCTSKFVLVEQASADGLGDAVLQTESAVGGESFLLVLGDHLFSRGAIATVMSAFDALAHHFAQGQFALTGVCSCSEDEIAQTGLLRLDDGHSRSEAMVQANAYVVADMAEKPQDSALSFRSETGSYTSQLGVDVLPREVFQILKELKRPGVELSLRDAQRMLIERNSSLIATKVNGHRYDFGNPSAYRRSFDAVYHESLSNSTQQFQSKVIDPLLTLSSISDKIKAILLSGDYAAASAPGRIDLMGGIADYSGSRVLQSSIAARLYAIVMKSVDPSFLEIFSVSSSGAELTVDKIQVPIDVLFCDSHRSALVEPDELIRSVDTLCADRDANMLACLKLTLGCVRETLLSSPRPLIRFSAPTVIVMSSIPPRVGLASSAALGTATTLAIRDWIDSSFTPLTPPVLQNIAAQSMRIEHAYTASLCGPMDHATLCNAQNNQLLSFIANDNVAEFANISLPNNVSLVGINSSKERLIRSELYTQLRLAIEMAKVILSVESICSLEESDLCVILKRLPTTLSGLEFRLKYGTLTNHHFDCRVVENVDYHIQAAVSHALEENGRSKEMSRILSKPFVDRNDKNILRELMADSHSSYSRLGLGEPNTNILVDLIAKRSNLLADTEETEFIGARISAGGGGGTLAVLMSNSSSSSSALARVNAEYSALRGLSFSIHTGSSGRLRREHRRDRSRQMSTACAPKVLLVNTGYPPAFNGGSEVYTQALAVQFVASGLCSSVHVFAREHKLFEPDYSVRLTTDSISPSISVSLINTAREVPYYRFESTEVDDAFRKVLTTVKPDIVHFGHCNHLSLNLPRIAKEYDCATVYTLHDFWLLCPRGQFVYMGPDMTLPVYKQCTGQENAKCATHCYSSRFGTGANKGNDTEYWTGWIAQRMNSTSNALDSIDCLIAPSKHLLNRFKATLPQEQSQKLILLPYGFDRSRLTGRKKVSDNSSFTIAYIGRHEATKGIDLILRAISIVLKRAPELEGSLRFVVFGQANPAVTPDLRRLATSLKLDKTVRWEPEYTNTTIVDTVFNEVDAIVVASIWDENSPLVIHEAQQCGVPVIASSHGGMGELVRDRVNGLTFDHRSADSLADAIAYAAQNAHTLAELGAKGYLFSSDGQIPSMKLHAVNMSSVYAALMSGRGVSTMDLDDSEHSGLSKLL